MVKPNDCIFSCLDAVPERDKCQPAVMCYSIDVL